MELNREFIYLACPYTDTDKHVEEERFLAATKAAAYLMRHGHLIYSPITHCHPMQIHGGLPGGWKFWRRMDETYIRHCHMMFVLMLPDWQKSIVVKSEIRLANELCIPILYLDPNNFHIDWEEKTLQSFKRERERSGI